MAYSPGDSILLVIVAAAVAVVAGRRALGWAESHGAVVEGVLIGAVVLAASAGAVTIWRGHARPGQGSRPPLHGWASRQDLGALLVPRPTGDRLVLGALNRRRLVAAEPLQSVLVVGPTQSGKTSGLAIPAILEWAGPVVATSVKSDLVRATHSAREQLGRVHLYDPTVSSGLSGVLERTGWSPLASSTSWPAARRTAAALCSVAREEGGMEDAGFWYSSAEKLLGPLLYAASSAGASMADVVRWIDEEELGEPLLALELAGVPDALRAARTSFAREERQRSSVFATAETVVAGFAEPDVAASTHGACIDPGMLVDGSARTLYCCAPSREQERLRPLFVAFVRQVIDAAFETAAGLGRPLSPPLLIVLDEAANIAPLSDLGTILSTAAGHGIQLVTVWQDLAQIETRYGRGWPTIVNNHRAKVLCPGIADPLTLDHVSSLIGEDERTDSSTTISDDGRRSRTESASLRRIAPSSMLRRLPPGEAAVVYGGLPPARVALRPYYEL